MPKTNEINWEAVDKKYRYDPPTPPRSPSALQHWIIYTFSQPARRDATKVQPRELEQIQSKEPKLFRLSECCIIAVCIGAEHCFDDWFDAG